MASRQQGMGEAVSASVPTRGLVTKRTNRARLGRRERCHLQHVWSVQSTSFTGTASLTSSTLTPSSPSLFLPSSFTDILPLAKVVPFVNPSLPASTPTTLQITRRYFFPPISTSSAERPTAMVVPFPKPLFRESTHFSINNNDDIIHPMFTWHSITESSDSWTMPTFPSSNLPLIIISSDEDDN